MKLRLLSMTTLVWVRRTLRLADNAPLSEAAQRGPVVPVFIQPTSDTSATDGQAMGGASKVWLHHALTDFAHQLAQLGSPLVILQADDPVEALAHLAQQVGATALFYDRRPDPQETTLRQRLEERLGTTVTMKAWHTNLLVIPGSVRNLSGEPFKVFTPFWKASLRQLDPPLPLPAPAKLIPPPSHSPTGLTVADLGLLPPRLKWHQSIEADWAMTEAGAQARWQHFITHHLSPYKDRRDVPGEDGTSKLSPYLHFGQISPIQLWHDVLSAHGVSTVESLPPGPRHFISELGWREFAHQLIHFFPTTLTQPLNEKFSQFPWQSDPVALERWKRGQTGYPIVDAGMRQLWATGWMHNRVRMVVGSLLVKHLLLPWQEGERWFWDTLVDADVASNTMGWQWIAGCGADAAPYFRVFNPVLQGEKFDKTGTYVRQWVPELVGLPDAYLHKPWELDGFKLRMYGVTLGDTYPRPIVDPMEGRNRALAAFEQFKQATAIS
jgi:deoxyribodipyrimidine photo-lyase